MANIPKKAHERLVAGIKQFLSITASSKSRSIIENPIMDSNSFNLRPLINNFSHQLRCK